MDCRAALAETRTLRSPCQQGSGRSGNLERQGLAACRQLSSVQSQKSGNELMAQVLL